MAGRIAGQLAGSTDPRVLVLGLTFKENIPDLRNSKVADLVRGLEAAGCSVDVHDPLADPADAQAQHGIALLAALDGVGGYDCVVGAVAHKAYLDMAAEDLSRLVRQGGLVFDLRDMWRFADLPEGLRRLTL